MSILAQEEQGGSAVRRIAQEVQRYAHEKWVWAQGNGAHHSLPALLAFHQQKENLQLQQSSSCSRAWSWGTAEKLCPVAESHESGKAKTWKFLSIKKYLFLFFY